MNLGPSVHDVCAVFSCFHPAETFVARVAAVRSQAAHTVIVDDSGNADSRGWLQERFGGSNPADGLTLIHNQANMGLAASLNAAIDLVGRLGYSWALLLDDDSIISPSLTADLVRGLSHCGSIANVASISPLYLRGNGPVNFGTTTSIPEVRDCRTVITAGSLTCLKHHRRLGGFAAEYFIDCVDHEYCLRAHLAGLRILQTNRVGVVQPLGSLINWRFLGRNRTISIHSPLRMYYFFRNSTTMSMKYGLRIPAAAATAINYQSRELVKACRFHPQRSRALKAALWGYLDAANRRMGKCQRPL